MEITTEARLLFNRAGFMATSFRGVATVLGISPGHLHYHFKNKEALLGALFQEIVDATGNMFSVGADPLALPRQWFTLQREYFFFFRELPALLLEYPSIRKSYSAIARKRIAQFSAMFAGLSAGGLVISEPEVGFFDRFAELLWHHANSALALLAASHGARSIAHAELLLDALLLPLLTEQGRAVVRRARE